MIPLFDYILLAISISICFFHKEVNKLLKKNVNSDSKFTTEAFIKDVIISLPLMIIIYRDMAYGSFGFNNLGIPISFNRNIDYILKVLGAYGMIQVLAQDTGLKTGIFQRNSVQKAILFAPIALGSGFGITGNKSMALISVLFYYHFKYAISNNVTSPVCFEDV
jgi:hypothetical protein